MAIRITDKPRATIEQAKFILEKHSSAMGIYIDLERVIDYDLYSRKKIISMTPILREWLRLPEVEPTQVVAIKNRVIALFDVDPNMLTNNKGTFALDKEVRARVMEQSHEFDPIFVEFIKFYDELAEMTTIQRQVKTYLEAPAASLRTNDNHRACIVRPKWAKASTGRLQSSEPNFQGMTRYMKDIIAAPEGYELVQADSGQIEPRIMYSEFIKDELLKKLIEVYDDAYFGQLHYITLTDEEELYFRENLDKVEKKEWDKSQRDVLKKLGLAGNYGGGNLERFDRTLAPLYVHKIVNHPLRKEWEKDVRDMVYNQGADRFYSSFGTEVKPEAKEGMYGDLSSWKNHLVRCGINNPLQTTAADLMAESVYEADRILTNETTKYGGIAAYIHDAGYFYLHQDDIHLADKLIDCLAYDVRDWIPIRSEGEIGKIKLSHVPVY